MPVAIPERSGCTDILLKINKLSKIIICRLGKPKIGSNQPTTLPSGHLGEPSGHKTPRTSGPPAPAPPGSTRPSARPAKGTMGEARGASPAPRLPSRAPRPAPHPAPRAPRPPPPSCGARPTCGGAGRGCTYRTGSGPWSRRAPAARRRPPGPASSRAARGAHASEGGRPSRRGVVAAGALGGCGPGRRRPLQEKLWTRYCQAPAQRRPASPRRPARALPSVCLQAGRPAAARGRRGGGAAAGDGAAGGAASQSPRRGALTPHPAAWPSPSCDSVSRRIGRCAPSRLPDWRRAACVPMATGARGGRGRAPLQPGAESCGPRLRGERPPGVGRGGAGACELKSRCLLWIFLHEWDGGGAEERNPELMLQRGSVTRSSGGAGVGGHALPWRPRGSRGVWGE